MKLLDRIKNVFTWESPNEPWRTLNVGSANNWDYYIDGSDKSEIVYFICLKILSESIGKLSVHLKDKDNKKITDNEAIQLLAIRPNDFMSATDFKTLMEYHRNDKGNAYAYIKCDRNGKRLGLYPLNPSNVKIIVSDNDLLKDKNHLTYEYKTGNSTYYFASDEIIHLKGGLSENGIVGKSVAEELVSTIDGAKESQKYLNDLYKRGLTANAILQYTGDLNKEKKEKLVKTITDFARSKDSGNIVPIPLGMDLKPLDIKLTDAQFFELRKFTSLQIAAAFGVKPNHLNNYDKSSYANSEMQNLTFYIDTLLFILSKWEQELDYKLLFESERKKGYHFEFNVATILRGDLKTQAEALTKFVQGSMYTPNEARKYLGMTSIDDGDKLMVNGSYTDLNNLGEAYRKGGENSDNSEE